MKKLLIIVCLLTAIIAPSAMAYVTVCGIEVTTVEIEAFDDIYEAIDYYNDLDEIYCPEYFPKIN